MRNRLNNILAVVVIGAICLSFTKYRKLITWETTDKTEVLKVYEKGIEWFTQNANCKVNIKYSSYKDYTSLEAYDHMEGFYKRDKNNIHSLIMGVNTIQNEKICLTVDSVNKMIVVRNKTDLKQSLFDADNFSKLLDNVKALKKQQIGNDEIVYRMEFKPNELYCATELIINNKGVFTTIKYYYSKELKENEDNPNSYKGKPRMEISFSAYQTNVSFNYDKEFSEKMYIKEEGGKIVLKDAYKKYELKDYRFTVKK